jgi:uncharacterized protein (DUF983 family)
MQCESWVQMNRTHFGIGKEILSLTFIVSCQLFGCGVMFKKIQPNFPPFIARILHNCPRCGKKYLASMEPDDTDPHSSNCCLSIKGLCHIVAFIFVIASFVMTFEFGGVRNTGDLVPNGQPDRAHSRPIGIAKICLPHLIAIEWSNIVSSMSFTAHLCFQWPETLAMTLFLHPCAGEAVVSATTMLVPAFHSIPSQ